MKPLTMQPTFVIELKVSPEIAIPKLRAAIATEELREYSQAAGSCLDYLVDTEQRRFWSPHLSVQISETVEPDREPNDREPNDGEPNDSEPQTSELHCRFSPRPEIWTMFMAIYAVIIALIFISAIYSYVQWFMGDTPWALAIVPLGMLLIAGLHIASLTGQRLSSDQMQMLRDRLLRTITLAFGSDDQVKIR
ncbi:hypothetical protein LF1_02770 [Rubripirellula obstinata]|uniref:Uncharacterized protein n=1 Tax=Rubripirellula obstinata TaxID=406547 RepID=A0A5B1C9H8_9BACT|nr:hypothetical protein [Rubripirellula obstinata]KAA1257787.1 hypothetical protein LF1_02770 [Rubripirellula obstinata]